MKSMSFEDQLATLARKFEHNPASRIFAPLAEAYRKAGRLGEALEVCREGLRHHPDYLSGRLVLARCHYDRGELAEAREAFEQVLRAEPQNLLALRAMGEIARARGEREEGARWYRKAAEAHPENAELRERLAEILAAPERSAAEDFGLAPAEGSRAGGAPAGGGIATLTLAEVYAEQGLHERALGVYERILTEDPGNSTARERADTLRRTMAEARHGAEAEAGTSLGGFIPGGLPGPEASAESTEEAWAFLLVDEGDRDPDELFAAASAASVGHARRDHVASGGATSGWGAPAGAGSRPSSPEPDNTLVIGVKTALFAVSAWALISTLRSPARDV